MKAVRLHQVGAPLRLDEVVIPDLDRGEVLVRVLRCGVKRGDLHAGGGGRPPDLGLGPTGNPLSDLPMTIGLDAVGEIAEIGIEVLGLAVGDRVIVEARMTCGTCRYCRRGREDLCDHHRLMGSYAMSALWSGPEEAARFRRYKDGFWAEYARVPATNVVKLQRGDDLDTFARITQVSSGYRALKRARVAAGESVIINGATGVTGTGAVIAALAMGAAQVIAVARNHARLAHVRSIDPRRVSAISTNDGPLRERILQLTGGAGANVLVDLTPPGADTTVTCLRSLERGGRAVLFGGNNQLLELNYRFLMIWSIEIMSSTGRLRSDLAELADLTRRGLIDLSPMTPQYYGLEEIGKAIESFRTRAEDDLPAWPMMRAPG
jgi:alcohol dehydrogenase